MTTITFPLNDEQAALLNADARTHGLSPEEWAREILMERLEHKPGLASDYETAIAAVLDENAELYRRLA